MPNLQQLNATLNFSLEPLKAASGLLVGLKDHGNGEMHAMDLHFELKKRFDFSLQPDLGQIRKLSWLSQPDLPIAKDNMGVAYAAGKVYAIGGRTHLGNDSVLQPEDSLVHVYDVKTKEWQTKQGMPYPHTGNTAVAASNGKIYSFGGYLKLPEHVAPEDAARYNIVFGASGISPYVQAYDPEDDSWLVCSSVMPAPRVFSSAVATEDGSVYVFGGYEYAVHWSEPAEIINAYKTFKYSVAEDQWSHVADMPTPRSGPAAVMGKDGKIYVLGGMGDDCQWLRTVEAYDPVTDTWEQKPDMLASRCAFSAVVDSKGRIYAIGGLSDSGPIASVEIYDPATGSWQLGPELTPARLSHGAVITEDDVIYAFGGSQYLASFGDILSSCKSWDIYS